MYSSATILFDDWEGKRGSKRRGWEGGGEEEEEEGSVTVKAKAHPGRH